MHQVATAPARPGSSWRKCPSAPWAATRQGARYEGEKIDMQEKLWNEPTFSLCRFAAVTEKLMAPSASWGGPAAPECGDRDGASSPGCSRSRWSSSWSLSLSLILSSSGVLPRGLQGAVCRHGQSRPVPGLRVASNKLRWDFKKVTEWWKDILCLLNFLCFIRWEFAIDFPHHGTSTNSTRNRNCSDIAIFCQIMSELPKF